MVAEVIWDPGAGHVTGVRVIDAESHEDMEFHARTVLLGASALESTRILLNSKSADFPDGLANSSGVLGKYLIDHTMGVSCFVRCQVAHSIIHTCKCGATYRDFKL